MGEVKPWQAVVMVAAVIALGVGLWLAVRGDRPRFPDSSFLADVTTGELFVIKVGGRSALFVPAKHPDTGVYSLLPVHEEDGRWVITERAMSSLDGIEGADAVDASSGVVNVIDGSPRRLDGG